MSADTSARPILVLGANGQLGHELPRALGTLGPVVSLDRAAADLSAPESLRAVIRAHRPRVIVNAAAYTAVDRAEREPELAMTVNGVAPGVLAQEAEAIGAVLVHYSTDYVFDGEKNAPYDERDAAHPLSVYGRTKLAGEAAVAAGTPRHLIFRASWVVGAHGTNFLKTMLRLAGERDSLRVVADQVGAPTSAALLAEVTGVALQTMDDTAEDDPWWGVYHVAAAGETSWHGYAKYLIGRARELGFALKATPERVAAITTAEYPTPARRPANSRLDTARLRATFPVRLPDWRAGVDQVLAQLKAEGTQ